jgi:hypothetical protein
MLTIISSHEKSHFLISFANYAISGSVWKGGIEAIISIIATDLIRFYLVEKCVMDW